MPTKLCYGPPFETISISVWLQDLAPATAECNQSFTILIEKHFHPPSEKGKIKDGHGSVAIPLTKGEDFLFCQDGIKRACHSERRLGDKRARKQVRVHLFPALCMKS